MPIKDLFNKIINRTETTAEEAAENVENAAQEAQDQAQDFMQGHMPPEPPKDENGNPIKPPEGMRPPFDWNKPTEESTNSEITSES